MQYFEKQSWCCCVNFQSFPSPPTLCGANLVLSFFHFWHNLPYASVCLTLHCICLQLPLKLVRGMYTNISTMHCTGMIVCAMVFKADKVKYNGLFCLVDGWCNSSVWPKNWSINGRHVLTCRLLINGWPWTLFGVLDIHNLLLWLPGVDVVVTWHVLVPILAGSAP